MQEDVFPKLQVAKIMIMKLPCKANILDVIILLNHKLWVNQIVLMEHPGVWRNNIILSTYTRTEKDKQTSRGYISRSANDGSQSTNSREMVECITHC